MALPQGIYFRATDNQTDPTNYDAEVATTANYPRTTVQGNSVGWEAAPDGTRDRVGATDVRLKGIHFRGNASAAIDYRIDITTGSGTVGGAGGDADNGQSTRVRYLDGTTSFQDDDQNTGVAQWIDAANNIDNEAQWTAAGNGTTVSRTFTTSIVRFRLGASVGVSSPNSALAAVYVDVTASGGGAAAAVNRRSLMGVGT
jgi:hypothetical protein